MHSIRYTFALGLVWVAAAARGADAPARAVPDVEPGQFSERYLEPSELQFGCLGTFDETEEKCAKLLAEGIGDEKCAAARALWVGRSRRQAANVLKFLAGPPPGGSKYRTLQRETEAALQPQAILRELKEGDYLWGTWLAFLRPHKDLVPTLLAGLKDKPKLLSETVLALGNSGDPRALEPLLERLKSTEYQTPGWAAQALGYFGAPEVEPKLIEALSRDNNWLQLKACVALGRMGTRKALPELEKLAKDDIYKGALNVTGVAEGAIKRITQRENR